MWEQFLPKSCCGYTLQTTCKVVAVTQWALAACLIILGIKRLTYAESTGFLIITGLFVAFQLFQLIFAGFLFTASRERHLKTCKVWFIVTVVITVATVFYIFVHVDFQATLHIQIELSPMSLIAGISVILNVLFLWIGAGFVNLLRDEEEEGGTVYNY